MTTVVLAAAVANRHRLGGSIWVRRSWATALQRLGFEVFLLDELSPDGTPDAFAETTNELGVDGALLEGDTVHGCGRDELLERLDDAALLVNLGGHLRNRELLRRPRVRAFVDLDPGYTQIWHAQGHDVGLAGHDHYFTRRHERRDPEPGRCRAETSTGARSASRSCSRTGRSPTGSFTSFTTVGSWRGAFGPVEWQGRSYGLKAHQFRRFATLPETVGLPFEVALAIDAADARDRELLESGGWRLRDPGERRDHGRVRPLRVDLRRRVLARPGRLRLDHERLVQRPHASATSPAAGPPSCRTPASSKHCRSGTDCSPSERSSEAADCARDVVARYATHREAARAIAEEFFSPEAALAPLLDATGVTP